MYVELWLKRKNSSEAVFYWNQARELYSAAQNINTLAAPLSLYYCFLNATKALLVQRGVAHGSYHGTAGKSTTKKATISGEEVTFFSKGVAPALSAMMADSEVRNSHTLKQLLYNLPFIHRAYTLSFKNMPEIFVPVSHPIFVRKTGANESWVMAGADFKFGDVKIQKAMPAGYERDIGYPDSFVIRKKSRFKWTNDRIHESADLLRLQNYNRTIRTRFLYIRGQPASWYFKIQSGSADIIDRSTLSIMLAAMHRLSELARYNPLRLQLLMETQQNWLISEFISGAPQQFLDEISAEMTGQNLSIPFVRMHKN